MDLRALPSDDLIVLTHDRCMYTQSVCTALKNHSCLTPYLYFMYMFNDGTLLVSLLDPQKHSPVKGWEAQFSTHWVLKQRKHSSRKKGTIEQYYWRDYQHKHLACLLPWHRGTIFFRAKAPLRTLAPKESKIVIPQFASKISRLKVKVTENFNFLMQILVKSGLQIVLPVEFSCQLG